MSSLKVKGLLRCGWILGSFAITSYLNNYWASLDLLNKIALGFGKALRLAGFSNRLISRLEEEAISISKSSIPLLHFFSFF